MPPSPKNYKYRDRLVVVDSEQQNLLRFYYLALQEMHALNRWLLNGYLNELQIVGRRDLMREATALFRSCW